MNCPEWLLRAAYANAIPNQIPAIVLDNGAVNDLNVSIRGSVQNGRFAAKQNPNDFACKTIENQTGNAITWGQIAEREEKNLALIAEWVKTNKPDIYRKYSEQNSARSRLQKP